MEDKMEKKMPFPAGKKKKTEKLKYIKQQKKKFFLMFKNAIRNPK